MVSIKEPLNRFGMLPLLLFSEEVCEMEENGETSSDYNTVRGGQEMVIRAQGGLYPRQKGQPRKVMALGEKHSNIHTEAGKKSTPQLFSHTLKQVFPGLSDETNRIQRPCYPQHSTCQNAKQNTTPYTGN